MFSINPWKFKEAGCDLHSLPVACPWHLPAAPYSKSHVPPEGFSLSYLSSNQPSKVLNNYLEQESSQVAVAF